MTKIKQWKQQYLPDKKPEMPFKMIGGNAVLTRPIITPNRGKGQVGFTLNPNSNSTINGVNLITGKDNSVFKADSNGIYLGNTVFASAPFSVDVLGNCKVSSLARDDFHWFTVFESVDGYSKITDGVGTIVAAADGVVITTGNVNDNDCQIKKSIGIQADFDKDSKFKCEVSPTSNSLQEIYIVVGAAKSDLNTTKHYGFYLWGNSIYATVADGSNNYQTELQTFSAGANIILEAALDVSTGLVKFYVNGALKLTSDGYGTPTGGGNYVFYINARTSTDAARVITIPWWDFWQAN